MTAANRAPAGPGSPDLRERYARALAAHHYSADSAQSAAVERLDTLRRYLLREALWGSWRRLAVRWTRRLAPRLLAASGRERAARGLYLWGGVGRGKTWLVDLFYDSLPLQQRRRSHFHHFMRDIHQQLQQLRQRREPLELLAWRI